MAISINWITGVVFVPRADMLEVQTNPVEVRQLDINAFRKTIGDLKDDIEGRPWTKVHDHTPPKTVAGVDLARVVEIVPPYTVTFEDGLYNVNIVGGNSNISDRNNKNTVGVNTANSAGLQDSTSLQAASFGGVVTISETKGVPGTVFPIGTKRQPSDNLDDGTFIAFAEGIDTLLFHKDFTIAEDVQGFILSGQNAILSRLVIDPLANVLNCQITNATVNGTLDGGSLIEDCSINGLNYVNGEIRRCALEEAIIFLGGTEEARFMDCKSGVSGVNTPTIDLGGSGQDLVMRNQVGGIRFQNRTGNDPASVDMISGHVIIGASCTGAPIILRGSYKLTVEAGATQPDTTGRTAMQEDVFDVPNTVWNKVLQ